MPISSTYRQTVGSNQPWNTTKSRRLSSTLPPTSTKSDYQSIRRLSSTKNRSNSAKFSNKKPQTRPAWVTGSFSLSNTNEGEGLNTLPIKGSSSKLSRRTLKRRQTSPVFSELPFTHVPTFKRSNSDSQLEPCELESKRKFRRGNVSQTSKYKRFGEKSATADHKKVDPESKVSPNNSKLCFNDYNQTPKELGQRVLCVLNKQIRSGVVHYLGSTHFSAGQWCGIVLDEPCGKNDGCVKGVRYFSCAENYGIFVHVQKVRTFDKPNFATDGLRYKESEDALGYRTIPRTFKYSNKTTMNSFGAAGSIQRDPINDDCTGYLLKKRSKSLSDGTNVLSKSSKCTSDIDTTWKDISRSRSLTDILDHREVCNKCKEIDSKCKCNLYNDLNIDANRTDDSLVGIKQSKQCPKTEAEPSISGELMTTTSISSNTDSLLNVISGGKERRSYSSDYIACVALKSKHDLDSPGPHAALERNTTIDAFVQDKYCSCPSLVPSQHLSSALEACIDLGRQELETYSEKVTPVEETQPLEFDDVTESEQESSAENNQVDFNSEKLPYHGRSKSLPLVLVRVRNISETESLFWSTDKLSGMMFKEERSASWPALSTSACRLDLRPDNKIDEAYNSVNSGQESKMIKDELVFQNDESDSNRDKHEQTKIFPLKKQNAVENLMQSDSESLSQSESQLSLSSVETSASRKVRKVSASSASSTRSQTRTKSQRNSKTNHKTDDKNKNKRNTEVNQAPFKLTKRHTTGLQKYQTTTLSSTTRPSMTKRPTSTLTSTSTTVSPTYGKSKLPTMKKSSSNKPTSSKPPVNKGAIRPASIALQDLRKPPGPPANQTAKDARSVSKTATQRKSSMPPSQKATAKTESAVKKRTQVTSKPGQPAIPATDRSKVSKTTTKTEVANKPKTTKPLTPQGTTGSPSSKTASSPSKPYHSRLPTRKITSRDGSIESSHSHECDIDTASIGTEESDYLDGHRLSRGRSISIDQCDADRSDLESSTKSWQYVSHAPDILTGTREIHRRSVEVQVELDDDNDEDIKHKYVALERLLHGLKNDCRDLELAVGERDSSLLSSAILIAALCKKLQGNGRLVVHLKKDLHITESELKQVQERLDEEEANAVKLQEEMMYVRSEHTVAIQNLKADHENTLEGLRYSLNKQYTDEIAKANDEHMKEMVELNKVHAEKEMEIKKHHKKNIAEVSEKYKDEIVELESKHSQHIDELLEEHQVEIETIKTDYEEQHGGLESKLFAVTKECASLNMQLQQLQEDTERDIQSRIQEAVEKYKALPAELESMKAVLDMRNEENKQLKKERMEAQMEVDHLRKVAERVKKLEHENESLSFVVENKSKFERQLSVEHEHLKNTLDRESKKLKRLSLENEELHWKLYQGSSPTEENTSFDFTANGSPPTTKRRSFRLSATSPDVGTIDE